MNDIFMLSPYCEEDYLMTNSSINYIRYYLIDNGYKCTEYDLSQYDHDYDTIIDILKQSNNPIVGITGYTRERFHAYRLINRIGAEIPDALIVVGGHHFGFLPNQTLENLQPVDIVVRDEGEITFKEICDVVTKEGSFNDVDGITFRGELVEKPGEIITNKPAKPERELSKFRSWDEDEFRKDCEKKNFKTPKNEPGSSYFGIMATRGCPSNCNFCSLATDIVRFRSVKDVLDEIEEKIAISGLRNVSFGDSSLTVNKNFVRSLCDGILERKLNIRWNCYSRADIRHDLLSYMRKAGCASIEVAVESGSPKVLKAIGKGITLDKYMDFVKHAHGLGIKIWCFLILSSTEETVEDARMTLELLRESAPYLYDFGLQVTRITPDTQLDRIAREKGVIPKDFDWFADFHNNYEKLLKTDNYETLPLYVDKMTIEEIQMILAEFDALKETDFVYPKGLRKSILHNLKMKRLKKLKFKDFITKSRRLFVMILNMGRTRSKLHYYNNNTPIIHQTIPRPDWAVYKEKSW